MLVCVKEREREREIKLDWKGIKEDENDAGGSCEEHHDHASLETFLQPIPTSGIRA